MKYLLLSLLLIFNLLPLHAAKVVVFETPAPNSRIVTADEKFFHETGNTSRMIVEEHPLVFIHDLTEVKTASGLTGYRRNDLTVSDDGKNIIRRQEFPWNKIVIAFAAAMAMIAITIQAARQGARDWQLLLLPVLLRIALLSITLSRWDCVFTIAADEPGYFETISDMLKGKWHHQWRFTVGTGFFYLPFIKLFNAETFYDIVPYFNFFSAYIIAPSILAAGFLILRKLGVSGKKSCFAMLIWAIFPFVAFHLEDWNIWKFQHLFLFPRLFTEFHRLVFYGFCINSGFNAMSDTPGLMLIMWGVYLALAMPPKRRYAICFGALYGFACLVRINYILLAPAFAILLFEKFKGDWKRLFTAAAASCGTFLTVFSIQLICNAMQFGSPFTFGYILHYVQNNPLDRPAAGFTWHTFSRLIFARYLLQSNLPVFAIGTAALWVMRPGAVRRFLVFSGVPIVLFFSGYSHTFCDARRFVFPAFAAFLMAIPAAKVIWENLSRKMLFQILLLSAAMVLVTTPINAYWKHLPLQIGKGFFLESMAVIVPLALAATAFMLWRRKHAASAVFIVLSMIFYYLPSELLGIAMLLLLIWNCGLDIIAAKVTGTNRLPLWLQQVQAKFRQ